MSAEELESFVKKFQHLWTSGYDAHLHVETHAGQAWVHLQVCLGQAQGPHAHQLGKNFPPNQRNSTSRQRRRARREAERHQKIKVAGTDATENLKNVIEKEVEISRNNRGCRNRDNMCDECLIFIAQREQIDLRNKYQCTVCKEVFQTKTLFRLHTQCSFETDSLVYICESCNQVWTDEETFEQHMKLKHVIHVCVRCNARLEGKNSLDDHFRAKHRAF